jgi:hypothetical protein
MISYDFFRSDAKQIGHPNLKLSSLLLLYSFTLELKSIVKFLFTIKFFKPPCLHLVSDTNQ